MSDTEELNILIVTEQRSADIRSLVQTELLKLYTPDMTLHINAINSQSGRLSDQVLLAKQNKLEGPGKYYFLYLMGGYEHMVSTSNECFTSTYDWTGSFVENMYELLYKTRNDLFEVSYRPVICEVIGLNLAKCNDDDTELSRQGQDIIDCGVPHLNRAITSINKDIDTISPWFGTTVHSVIHHKLHHKYMKLEDGYHLNDNLKKNWATLLAKAIVKNCGWVS